MRSNEDLRGRVHLLLNKKAIPRYSCRNATIGSTFVARRAGM